jgi:hypothetical protein
MKTKVINIIEMMAFLIIYFPLLYHVSLSLPIHSRVGATAEYYRPST